MDRLSEAEYDERAQPELLALRDAIDAVEAEGVEADLESGILTLEFEDDVRYVINSHQAARQIWMAADRSAWHFDWQSSQNAWIASKTGEELWSVVERAVSTKLGQPVQLRRPA